jgi:hypothetical protein
VTCSRLLLLVLTLLLVLPPGYFGWQENIVPSTTIAPGMAAPQEAVTDGDGPTLEARKHGKWKARRRSARKADRKERREQRRERKQRGQSPEQIRIAELVEDAPPRIPALAEDDPCGPGLIQMRKSGRCTHGPDTPPPADLLASFPDELALAEAGHTIASRVCVDDGESGFRVQVLYVRSSSGPDNYASSLKQIRDHAAGANTILQDSAIAAAGQEMNFSFVMTPDCAIDVGNVVVSPNAIRNFDALIRALEQQGYDRVDRIYLMFADTNSAGYCGIGTLWNDDRPTVVNHNNRGPSYSRVDRNGGCWSAYTAAHELMHNLGGVQDSAPNSSKYGHCIDEYDVMCYVDGPGVVMQVKDACKDRETFESRFDCNNDDYFHPSPPAGSYLASRWNTANNWFLTQDYPDGVDLIRPTVLWQTPVTNGQTYVTSAGTVSLQVDATDNAGIAYVEFWLYDAVANRWSLLDNDTTAPYTSSVNVSTLRNGLNYITAAAFDIEGNWVEEEIWLHRVGATVSLSAAPVRVKQKKRVTITASVVNPPSDRTSIEIRVCRRAGCTWDSGQTLGVFPGPTATTTWKASGKGSATFLAQAASPDGAVSSIPVTVSVKKVKKKR